MLKQGTSWYALDSKKYLLPPPCLDDSQMYLQTMASELITIHHDNEGLLTIMLPKDTVNVDLEVMTLTGIHVNKKDKSNLEKKIFPLEQGQ